MRETKGARRCVRTAWACVFLGLLATGCDSPRSTTSEEKDRVVAKVNGDPITVEDVRAHFLSRPEASTRAETPLPRVLVEQLVERRLLLQRFRETGEYVSEGRVRRFVEFIRRQYGGEDMDAVMREEGIDEAAWRKTMRETLEIEMLLEKEVYRGIRVLDEEVEEYYARNREKFRVGRRWRVRQIVVASDKMAAELRKRILDGESFASLAREHSIGPEREDGGDMGYFERGELPRNIEEVVESLASGEVSRVVRSPTGHHLLEVSERRLPMQQTLASVREKIRSRLLADKGRARLESWLEELRRKANIQYYWENLANVASG